MTIVRIKRQPVWRITMATTFRGELIEESAETRAATIDEAMDALADDDLAFPRIEALKSDVEGELADVTRLMILVERVTP